MSESGTILIWSFNMFDSCVEIHWWSSFCFQMVGMIVTYFFLLFQCRPSSSGPSVPALRNITNTSLQIDTDWAMLNTWSTEDYLTSIYSSSLKMYTMVTEPSCRAKLFMHRCLRTMQDQEFNDVVKKHNAVRYCYGIRFYTCTCPMIMNMRPVCQERVDTFSVLEPPSKCCKSYIHCTDVRYNWIRNNC